MAVVIASNLRKELGGDVLFEGVSFKVERRDRVALAGPNGAGKTTLLRMLSRETELHGGELAFQEGTRVCTTSGRRDRVPLREALNGSSPKTRRPLSSACSHSVFPGEDELVRQLLAIRGTRLAYGGLAAVLFLLTGFAIRTSVSTTEASNDATDAVRESRGYDAARLALANAETALHELLLTVGPLAEKRPAEELRDEYTEATARTREVLTALLRQDDDREDVAALNRLVALHRQYVRLGDQLLAAIDDGAYVLARGIDVERMEPIFDRIDALVREKSELHRERAAAALSDLDRVQRRAFVETLVVFGTGLALLAGLGVLLELARRANEARRLELLRVDAERRALDVQNERLRELDLMKDDFVASVSHELRTPLTSIRGYLELVLGGDAGELTDEQEQFLGIVERNADRLLRVVGDLLFVARVGSGTLHPERAAVDVDALVEQALSTARPAVESKEISLNVERGDVPTIDGDPARIGQMPDNLVSNAIKFTPVGGRVDVRTLSRHGLAVIEVANNGMGIPPAEQDRLFERFYRTDAATAQAIPGTGLGLAISKAVAEAHGGSIAFESAEGVGTTFRVTLPLEPQGVRA